MKVLIACEYSGVVRDAFIKAGHNAISCDLLPSDSPGPHYQGDVFNLILPTKTKDLFLGEGNGWDLMICHPPCTHLSVSGARHFKEKIADGRQQEAIDFFMKLVNCNIPRIAVENPISIMSTKYRKPDQIIQPWQFGHGETKATCLWLKNLPLLVPTDIVEGREARVHMLPPSKDRWKLRSTTYSGIASAMADQWLEFIKTFPSEGDDHEKIRISLRR